MKNKILALILALLCVINMGICASAEGEFAGLTIAYTLKDGTDAGIADGTITISGITEAELATVTAISLYWGDAKGAKLGGYDALRNYAATDYNVTSGIAHTIAGNRLLPTDAASIVAEVTHTGGTATAYAAIAEGEAMPKGEPTYTMFWISDIHFDYTSYNDNSQKRKTLRDINSFYTADGNKFKGVVINGDLTESGVDWELNNLEKIVEEEVGTKYPVYLNTGNHDVCNGHKDECFDAMQKYFSRMERMGYSFERTDMWSYDTWINGEHYIFLSTPYDGSWDNKMASQRGWLETKLAESDGKPTYVFSHMPVQDSGTRMTSGSAPFVLKDVLDRHPGVITITSHVHNNFNLEDDTAAPTVVVNTDGTAASYLDTSSSGKAASENGTAAFGRYVQVYPDKVIVRARNFSQNTWASRAEYVIPLNVDNGFEGKPSISYTSLAEGSVLTAQLDGAAVTDAYTCEWFVGGESVGTGTEYTVVTANTNASVKITRISDGAYAWATTSYFTYVPPTNDGESGGSGGATGGGVEIQFTNDNTVKFHNGIAKITGQVAATYAGQKIMLVVSPKSNPDEVKYINEVVVGADGTYSFKFKAGTITADDFLKAKIQGVDVTNSIIAAKDKTEGEVALTLTLDASNKPIVTVQNNYYDAATTKLIIATYNQAGELLDVVPMDYSLAFSKYGEISSYTGTAVTGNNVRVYMIDNYDNVRPLAKNVTPVIIPQLAAE